MIDGPVDSMVILAAVKVRWTERNLGAEITHGITLGDPKEKTDIPRAKVDNVYEVPGTKTNMSRFGTHHFDLTVYAAIPETAGRLARLVRAALLDAPLRLKDGHLFSVEAGTMRFFEENYFHKAVTEYTVVVVNAANYSPP